MAATEGLKARVERNALWISLGAIALAAGFVAVGVAVAPEVFWDRFVWEDLYGPLVVDARQCRTAAACPDLDSPPGIHVKDGYTVTSELTYGVVLAVLLYGIYVGLFRRYHIQADGRFVLGLLPWILLGPLGRVLEDADVFCRPGTHCEPGPFAFLFISPVIYLHIAAYVIAFMLLGVFVERRRHADPRLLSGLVGTVLLGGFAIYAFIALERASWFSALVPLWWVALSCLAALVLFHGRARQGRASMNLTLFVLGMPFALGCLFLIGWWMSGPSHVWAEKAWNGEYFRNAGAFILLSALAVALAVPLLARALDRSGVPAAWSRLAARIPPRLDRPMGWAALVGLGLAVVLTGAVPALAGFLPSAGTRALLLPVATYAGSALVLAYAWIHVGRDLLKRPHAFLIYTAGINVALVFGHMIDGIATWTALNDPLGFGIPPYSEKHPFSEFLLQYWDGFLFPFAKLVMVLVVVWLLDRELPADTKASWDERNLIGLVKMAIFVLGFAPGLRDLLRLAMGV